MKNFIILFVLVICLLDTKSTFSQNTEDYKKAQQCLQEKSEVYLKIKAGSESEIRMLSKVISISNVKNNEIFAFASEKQFRNFTNLNISYEVLPHPGTLDKAPKMFGHFLKDITDWNSYPTYQAYIDMMNQYQTDYPGLCRIVNIGQTVDGRDLLFAVISDNVNDTEAEPRFMYTSTMHGDEVTGYNLMLRLIDYLLTNYGTDSFVTSLVNNIEIWINPNANPDGTYAGGNNTVNGSIRYNSNGVDLNRNFPDWEDGPHPDGEEWQPETIAMMNLADSLEFVMSANFHTGAELFNYVWDTKADLNADDSWWQLMGRMYADTIHAIGPSGYFTDLNNGITNGYAWYEVNGGRQDYMNYYHRCREVTIELSAATLPNPSTLTGFWNSNYRSLLNYISECHNGVRGIVTDSITGDPLYAHVFVNSHDTDNTDIFTRMPFGDYYRPIYHGTYSITYSSPGYQSKTLSVTVVDHVPTVLDVQLVQIAPEVDFYATITESCTGEIEFVDMTNTAPGSTYLWDFGDGTTSAEQNPVHFYSISDTFTVTLSVTNLIGTNSFSQNDYIIINLPPSPSVTSDTLCGSGSVTLSATGSGTLNWYTDSIGGTPVFTGNSFTTPVIDQTTSYFVEDVVEAAPLSAAKPDNSGGGGYFNNNTKHYLVFDCYAEVTLKSVRMYASGAGDREIQLQDISGNVLQSLTVNVPDGESVVDLNFNLPVANDLRLVGPSFPNLYRNNAGCTYPYTLTGVLSVKYSSAQQNPTGYYYYFYDWTLLQPACISARTEATVTIIQGVPSVNFTYVQNGYEFQFTNLTTGAGSYLWDFGDGATSSEYQPAHTYSLPGDYTIRLIALNICGSDTFTTTVTVVNNVPELSNGITPVRVMPNPTTGKFTITVNGTYTSVINIRITDILGNVIINRKVNEQASSLSQDFDLSEFPRGVYLIVISTDNSIQTRRIIKE
jgi:PKD repeat protein/murein tripeptide amidase MpaA